MYKDFFSLKESPFTIIPSARFLYLSERHREALNHMVSGLADGGGFALLTGEVGTGKTTVLRALISRLEENTQVATILNPSLSANELLASLCDELALSYTDANSLKQLTDTLFDKLKSNEAAGKQTVLIIDEAQHLMPDVLEQLRLLTNLESENRKLLKVVLIGQPELQQLLQQDNLRQLAQRITSRYHLLPLTETEVASYIGYRLQTVDCLETIFNAKSMTVIAKRTMGIPRLINLVCDKSMQIACQQGKRIVTADIAGQACDHVLDWQSLTIDTEPQKNKTTLVAAAIGLALVGVVGYKTYPWFTVPTLQSAQPVAEVEASSVGVSDASTVLVAQSDDIASVVTAALSTAVETTLAETTTVEPIVVMPVQPVSYPDDVWSLVGDERQALRTLARLWGIALAYPQSNCGLLASGPMQCYQSTVSLPLLRMVDKPAVVTLYQQDATLYAVVYAVDENQIELLIDGYKVVVSHDWFESHWLGESLWLWKPPFADTVILPGQSGEPVRWLDQRLALVLGERQLNTRTLTPAMRNRVSRFQQNQLLDADGIPGPMTLMSLQSALRLSGPDLMPLERKITRIDGEYTFAPYPQLPAGNPLLLTAPPETELTSPVLEAPVVAEQVPRRETETVSSGGDNPIELDLSELSPELAKRVQAALEAGEEAERTTSATSTEDAVVAEESSTEPSVVPIGQLPLAVQDRLPTLNFQTHIYASTAGARWVKVNDRELFEGDEIAPGLTLEKIAPNHVEMGFENYLFSMPALSEW
ncbi:AAA family ATPase [Thaumasiovibrio subtropicus]|uniref:AAA family ATPase n=1 Tax=Thaumasiovibrio subtropicus TaxID=1891207 RepID=UPI00131C39FA|nr:AAA family ATPase [Thaumasiovibrio subtropicus]